MPEEATRSALRRSSATSASHGTDDDGDAPSPRHDEHQATRDRVLASLLSCPNTQTTRPNGNGAAS
jgi:hypothetical protein